MELELSQAPDVHPNESCEICQGPVSDPYFLTVADAGLETRLYGHQGCLADVQKTHAQWLTEEQTT